MSDAPTIVRLDSAERAAEEYFLAPEKLIRGNPKQTVWMHYTDPSGQFMVGLWRSEPGLWRVRYTEQEYCHILDGTSVLTDAAGHAVTVSAGDSFVVPRGFVGTWEVVVTTTKRFVIHEPPA
jgi:uncharacterized cupin superfamily protein